MKSGICLPRMLCSICFGVLMIFTSCEKEVDPEPSATGNNPPQTSPKNSKTFTADELLEHLKFKNSTRQNGIAPLPAGGNVRINFKDTLYTVKGTPIGERVEVWHNGQHDITGFFVAVSNSTFYYDVPVVEEESRDNTDVFIFYMDDMDGMDFPFSFEITILPHVNGIPVKKFVRVVTLEDPEDQNCSALGADCANDCMDWIWEFTNVTDKNGDIYNAYAPGMFIKLTPFEHGGCCWNGFSIPSKYDPYCTPGNPEYVPVIVDDQYYVRYFESLHLFSDGTYERFMDHEDKNYATDSSDYCSATVGYFVDRKGTQEKGNHSYSFQSDQIYFTVTSRLNAKDGTSTTSGWGLFGGTVLVTCHSLIITQALNGELWASVYRRRAVNWNPIVTYLPEYYE